MNLHELKIKKEYYLAVSSGLKTFEIRKNDRNFQIGDLIHFIPIKMETKIIKDMMEARAFEKITKTKPIENYNLETGGYIYMFRYEVEFEIPDDEVWQVTYVLKDVPEYGLDKEYCILGIRRLVNEK